MNSFSETSANVAVNHILLKIDSLDNIFTQTVLVYFEVIGPPKLPTI